MYSLLPPYLTFPSRSSSVPVNCKISSISMSVSLSPETYQYRFLVSAVQPVMIDIIYTQVGGDTLLLHQIKYNIISFYVVHIGDSCQPQPIETKYNRDNIFMGCLVTDSFIRELSSLGGYAKSDHELIRLEGPYFCKFHTI